MRKPQQLQLPFSSISLRRIDAETNCSRFYVLDVERDLFGRTVLARRWGRIGTYGRARFDEHPDEEAAHAALASLALAKQRRGYKDRMLFAAEPPNPQKSGHGSNASRSMGPSDDMIEPALPF
jgi:predicted DNA-binding WGR domain protein